MERAVGRHELHEALMKLETALLTPVVAKVLFVVFLVLFLVSLLTGMRRPVV